MTIQERIENAERELKKAKILLEGQDKIIYVLDHIKIENEIGGGDSLGIVFYNNKSLLFCPSIGSVPYCVSLSNKNDFIKCKLVKVDECDLKIGYTYFHTDDTDFDFADEKLNYCKYLGKGKYAYIERDTNVVIGNNPWRYWYQVVPIGE